MKKFLTFKNILICAALVLAVVAFVLSFVARFSVTMYGQRGQMLNFVWGCNEAIVGGHKEVLPNKAGVSAILATGSLFILIGAIGAAVVGFFLKKPWAKWVVVGLAALVLVGGVFQFFYVRSFANAMGKLAPAEYQKQAAEEYFKMFKSGNPTSAGVIVEAILGILAGCALGAAALLPEKK